MFNNVFANNARIAAGMTTTENGHAAASTTGSAVLDLYGQVGGLRDQDFDSRIKPLFDAAISDDKLLAAKTMFYARDARGGVGERNLFRQLLRYAAINHPDMVRPNLKLVPFYGRWDDLYALVGTPLERDAFQVIIDQYYLDICCYNAGKPVSIMAKWLKSCNTSSNESRKLGRLTCKYLGMDERSYRKILSKFRERIAIVEAKMSANEWKEIEYDKLPSRAGMIYREAFRKHDEDRYKAYIESVQKGEKKINTAMNTPQDLVHAYCGENYSKFCDDYDGGYPIEEDGTIEAMWKNLPDFVESDENILCIVDTSGSMYGRPIEVSTGLGMYFAQKNRGAFHNLFMTFSTYPEFVALDDNKSFLENLRTTFSADWGGSTDLNLACKEMLNFAIKHRVPQKDMPTRLIVISDMEINDATREWGVPSHSFNDPLHIEELKEMYEEAGYSVPQVIYWNVESRHNHFQTRSDVKGTMLASGSSPAVFKAVMTMEDLEVTPLDAMLEVLNGERYAGIKLEETGA